MRFKKVTIKWIERWVYNTSLNNSLSSRGFRKRQSPLKSKLKHTLPWIKDRPYAYWERRLRLVFYVCTNKMRTLNALSLMFVLDGRQYCSIFRVIIWLMEYTIYARMILQRSRLSNC